MPETSRVLFQKQIWEITESSWFYDKNFYGYLNIKLAIFFIF